MLDVDIDIDGFEEIHDILSTFQPKVEKRILKRALTKGALVIKKIARSNAPTSSGNLIKAIAHRSGRLPVVQVYVAAGKRVSKAGKTAADGWYAHFIERGTKSHSLRKGARLDRGVKQDQTPVAKGIRANPFMDRSLNQGFNSALGAIATEAERLIYKEVWK